MQATFTRCSVEPRVAQTFVSIGYFNTLATILARIRYTVLLGYKGNNNPLIIRLYIKIVRNQTGANQAMKDSYMY